MHDRGHDDVIENILFETIRSMKGEKGTKQKKPRSVEARISKNKIITRHEIDGMKRANTAEQRLRIPLRKQRRRVIVICKKVQHNGQPWNLGASLVCAGNFTATGLPDDCKILYTSS